MSSVVWLLVPLPIVLHVSPCKGPHLVSDLRFAQLKGGHPVGIHATTHLAYLVGPALQRTNPPGDKGADEIVRRRNAGIMHLLDKGVYLVGFGMAIAGIVGPVVFFIWSASNVCRQVDEIIVTNILDIKESFLPLPARF